MTAMAKGPMRASSLIVHLRLIVGVTYSDEKKDSELVAWGHRIVTYQACYNRFVGYLR